MCEAAEAINDKYEGTTDRRTARILSELNPLLVGGYKAMGAGTDSRIHTARYVQDIQGLT